VIPRITPVLEFDGDFGGSSATSLVSVMNEFRLEGHSQGFPVRTAAASRNQDTSSLAATMEAVESGHQPWLREDGMLACFARTEFVVDNRRLS
jgi:hypothetical protein